MDDIVPIVLSHFHPILTQAGPRNMPQKLETSCIVLFVESTGMDTSMRCDSNRKVLSGSGLFLDSSGPETIAKKKLYATFFDEHIPQE